MAATHESTQLSAIQLVELTQAASPSELKRRASALLTQAFPGSQHTLLWAADVRRTAAPPWVHQRIDNQQGDMIVTLQAAGMTVGWLSLRPGPANADQEQWLCAFAAVLSTSYLALQRRIDGATLPDGQQYAALSAALRQLRGIVELDHSLAELSKLVREVSRLPVVLWALRYRESDWIEMRYLHAGEHSGRLTLYWRLQAEVGLSNLVILTGQPVETDNYLRACEEMRIAPLTHPILPPAYTWLGLPLRDHERVFGALVLFSDDPDQHLEPEARDLVFWLAEEAAALIRMAQWRERALEEARQRQVLNQITRTVTSSLDPERVIALIVEQAPLLLNAEECSLLLLDENTGDLEFCYATGPVGAWLLGQRVPAGKGIAGYVARSGQSAIVNDTQSDGRFYRALDGDSGFQTRSILAVPLRGIDGVKGVIEVLNRHDNAPFVEDDRDLLEALADQAMIALENARRFASVDQALARRAQELDRSNERLRAILHASNMLRVERQVDLLADQIVGVVSASSGFRQASVALVHREDPQHPWLRLAAYAGPGKIRDDQGVSVSQVMELLRPEFMRGTLTYLLEHGIGQELGLLPPTEQPSVGASIPSPGAPELWRADDLVICLLRNSRSELIGVLALADPEDGLRPGAEQVQILEILANQAASAIENAYLYAAQQQSLNRMMALNGFSRALSTTLRSPQEILALTAGGMLEMSGAQWAAVLLGDQATPHLEMVYHVGAPCPDKLVAEQLAHQAAVMRRPVNRRLSGATGSVLAVPLRSSGETCGAVCLGFKASIPDHETVEILALFASQAASAIDGLRLLAQVRQGHDQLASIMASTRDGLVLVTATGHVAVANDAFYRLAGVTSWANAPDDLTGMTIISVLEQWQAAAAFPPHEHALLVKGISAVAEGREQFVQGQLNRAGPGVRALEWSVLRVTQEGDKETEHPDMEADRRRPILFTVRDITAAKAAEQLRQDLTSMMVHDLRTPLASIITSIDMIRRGITGEVFAKQREILEIAHGSAQNLLNMINLLLDISRLEGGGMPLERTRVDVQSLVRRAQDRVSLIARERQITIVTQIDPAAGWIEADAELVLRVLQNLLDNALKYSPTQSQVTLAVRPEGPAMLRFSVEDHGIGIEPGDLERIFTKFGQAGNQRRKGSGLGLTFCKLVVEAHGGRIWVESTPGKGSTFFFTLPILAPEVPCD